MNNFILAFNDAKKIEETKIILIENDLPNIYLNWGEIMDIVVLFGAKSVEHEISIISAFQVISALKIKYNVIPLYVSKESNCTESSAKK